MTDMDRKRILRGLVEHEGHWIPVRDKIALLEGREEKEPPLTERETAAVARFADALKGEETDSWSIPQTRLRNEIYNEEKVADADTLSVSVEKTDFDIYKDKKRRTRIILLAVAVIIVAFLIAYMLLL